MTDSSMRTPENSLIEINHRFWFQRFNPIIRKRMSKTLSNGVLSLRFMQNAQRAKQLQEVKLQRAEVVDEGKWEISHAVREAWGLTNERNEDGQWVAKGHYIWVSCISLYLFSEMQMYMKHPISHSLTLQQTKVVRKIDHSSLQDDECSIMQPWMWSVCGEFIITIPKTFSNVNSNETLFLTLSSPTTATKLHKKRTLLPLLRQMIPRNLQKAAFTHTRALYPSQVWVRARVPF